MSVLRGNVLTLSVLCRNSRNHAGFSRFFFPEDGDTYSNNASRVAVIASKLVPSVGLVVGLDFTHAREFSAFIFDVVASQEKDGYYLRRFSMGEHSATHMNAPNSFHPDAVGVGAYKPESLVRSAIVIDVRAQALDNPDYVIGVQDIETWEQAHGRIDEGSVVLFYTGWQVLWDDPKRLFNEDASGPHFSGVGAATTRFLPEERRIAGIGIDTHGADPGHDAVYATNSQNSGRRWHRPGVPDPSRSTACTRHDIDHRRALTERRVGFSSFRDGVHILSPFQRAGRITVSHASMALYLISPTAMLI